MPSEARQIREACEQDATAMAGLINDIILEGGTTAHRKTFSAERIIAEFIRPTYSISCFVAYELQTLLGFQALELCDPDWPGEDHLPSDWAVIATYVAAAARGRGVGRDLFEMTKSAARHKRVRWIDATIRRENALGLDFYGGIGFVDYRSDGDAISKRFDPN